MNDFQTVWEGFLKVIRHNVSPQNFKTWFEPICPLSLEHKVLMVGIPSRFFYDFLEKNYVPLIRKALDTTLGIEGKLEYTILEEPKNTWQSPLFPDLNTPKRAQGFQANSGQAKDFLGGLKDSPINPFQRPQFTPEDMSSQLKVDYTFETLVAGSCNQLAYAAAESIAERLGTTSFNPFVVYGGVGFGKTHLVQALGNHAKTLNAKNSVLYVSSDQFTSQYIDAVKNGHAQGFSDFYMNFDVLIVDDVQFFAGKEKTQESFFNIFNVLYRSGKQIVITSDRPPRSMEGIHERLRSRFQCGLIAEVEKPDLEMRISIIKLKLQREGIEVADEIVRHLALNISSNVRELEGAIYSLIGRASFLKKGIDMDLAKYVLRKIIKRKEKEITVELIQETVAVYFKVSVDSLKATTRKKEIVLARQVAMFFAKEYTDLSLKAIGESFGGRDHSTVSYANKKVAQKGKTDSFYAKIINDISETLKIGIEEID